MSDKVKLIIDGKEVTGKAGDSILNIARENGIEIPNLCYMKELSPFGACGLCVVEAQGSPKLLRACSTAAADGMVINTKTERVIKTRQIALELIMGDHVGDCVGPCKLNCPAHTDCQKYIAEIAAGDLEGAVKTIKEIIPLPACIGRICPHPCETACRRQYVEEPLSIAYLKYFAADEILKSGRHILPGKLPDTGKSVGIIGGGPAGIAAAFKLIQKGHSVTIYDQMPKMGGMLRYGIPEYRLPKAVLDAEIDEIASLGVKMVNNFKIGKDASLAELRSRHDAVLAANGAWKSSDIRCPGTQLEGVFGGIDFLREVAEGKKPEIGEKTAIVGGGNTAMDACRTAVRLGAKEVYVIYRRSREEMPADESEIEEAIEEGVRFLFLTNPDEIIGNNGHVSAVRLQVMRLGEPDERGRRSPVPVDGEFKTVEIDSIIAAIGQKNDSEGFEDLKTTKRGTIFADEVNFSTSAEGVFAAGDNTNEGASIAISAIGEGNTAAVYIDAYLSGIEVPYKKPVYSEKKVSEEMFADKKKQPREKMPLRPAEERRCDFKEITLGFTPEQAMKEAARCLSCGCHDYGHCKLIKYANDYTADGVRLQGEYHKGLFDDELEVIERDHKKCILCGLCVRVCDEIAGESLLGLVGRGFNTVIKPEFRNKDVLSICKNCGKCVENCPTGALKFTNK